MKKFLMPLFMFLFLVSTLPSFAQFLPDNPAPLLNFWATPPSIHTRVRAVTAGRTAGTACPAIGWYWINHNPTTTNKYSTYGVVTWRFRPAWASSIYWRPGWCTPVFHGPYLFRNPFYVAPTGTN